MDTIEGRPVQITRVDLPGGQWAEIRTADSLRRGDQRAVRQAAKMDIRTGEDNDTQQVSMGITESMRDALIARVITAWSLDLQLPIANPDVLDELDLATYEALTEATADHWSRVDFKGKRSTSRNSSDSRPRSKANGSHPVSISTTTQPTP